MEVADFIEVAIGDTHPGLIWRQRSTSGANLPRGARRDMMWPGGDQPIYVATRPVDFRKGHDGLSALVRDMFGLDPFSGTVFVFRSKRADRIKILAWDRNGLVLIHKRLDGAKFVWPAIRPVVLTRKNALFAGNQVGAENWALLASSRHAS